MENYCNKPGWPNVITGGPYKREAGGSNSSVGNMTRKAEARVGERFEDVTLCTSKMEKGAISQENAGDL